MWDRTMEGAVEKERALSFDEARAQRYIDSVKWQFAKTMPWMPHWYTVVTWKPGWEVEFRWFARLIEECGVDERFVLKRYRYLTIGKYKYWIMSRFNECILINRAEVSGAVEQGSSSGIRK